MDNWISVNDRLPEEEGKYLVFIVDELSSFIDIRHFYKINKKFGIVSWYVEELGRKVTHWQPLPELPELLKGGAE